MSSQSEQSDDVAVIGMAGRFPGAGDLAQFWSNLVAGRESIHTLTDAELEAAGVPPDVYRAAGYVRASSRLDDIRCFDADLFGYSAREAALMDPQSRISLQLAWHALEDSGYSPRDIKQSVGVFATASLNTYLLQQLVSRFDSQDFVLGLANIPLVLGNAPDFIATRLSYKLNLRGPSIAVQTACSSSLTAIHLARQSILNAECEMALVGGVSIYLPQDRGYQHQEGMILSRDGHCRAFDAAADGVVFGRGGGFVVLKPLEQALADGDRIRAVIKGSAINNDGARKVGFTAPSVAGQARAITEALADADVSAETISYVEAHGTGTAIGDPIEIAGLTEAFRTHTSHRNYCALGTVKSNFGHLDVAAGVTGLIKTVLMLEHRQLVPSLNFQRANPAIDFANSPFFVNTSLTPWSTSCGVRRAGISAFGMGGANAHVILEEAPAVRADPTVETRPLYVLRLAAQSDAAVQALARNFALTLRDLPAADLAHFCSAANAGRAHLPERLVVRGRSGADLSRTLEAVGNGHTHKHAVRGCATTSGGIAFLFPGMGTQYAGMGAGLYRTQPVFRQVLQACEALLRPQLAVPLLEVLYPPEGTISPIDSTQYTQPALFAFEIAVAKLWESWGIRPSAVIGHSLGEFAAACIAGLLSLEEGLRIVTERGRLMDSVAAQGAMCAVAASEEQVAPLIAVEGGLVSIASVNGPRNVVISGEAAAMSRTLQRLSDRHCEVQPLRVPQAFHSCELDPMLDAFEEKLRGVHFGHSQIPVISNLTGEVLGETGRDPRYWRRHAREPVRFAAGIHTLYGRGIRTFLEIGPHTVASGMAAGCVDDTECAFLASLRRGCDDDDQLLATLSALYVRGCGVDWARIEAPAKRRHMPMPLYPFARTPYWVEAPVTPAMVPAGVQRRQPMLARTLRSPLHSELCFELSLDAKKLQFLQEHRICGATIVPATAYIEVALEAASASNTDCNAIAGLEISEALHAGSEAPHDAQLVLRSDSAGVRFEIHATPATGLTPASGSWRQYAAGGLLRIPATPSGNLELEALRARCTERIAGERYYRELARLGYEYGPSFRGIQTLWRTESEALAEIHIPDSLREETGHFRCHPALLDACLQTILSLLPRNRTFLPVRFGRVVLHGQCVSRLLVNARLLTESQSEQALQCDVDIVDSNGAPIVEVREILLRERPSTARSVRGATDWETWLYEVQWRDAPRPSHLTAAPAFASLADIATNVRETLGALRAQHYLQDYEAIQRELDVLCGQYVAHALWELGWRPRDGESFSAAELAQALTLPQKHRSMLRRMLEMLAEDGAVQAEQADCWRVVDSSAVSASLPDASSLQARYPRFKTMLNMVERCGRELGKGLRGSLSAVDLLFPDGSITEMENLYHHSPFAVVYNELLAEIVGELLPAAATTQLRVLELGAGTGGTSAAILPRLPPQRAHYLYTDVSPFFLARAEERFARYPFVRYGVYDVDGEPTAQGLDAEAFDVIVASNVLHTAKDLKRALGSIRRLLAPGGVLLLVEGVARQRWVDLLFGLTTEWWHFTDSTLRPNYPLLTQEAWQGVLHDAGFEDRVTLPGAPRAADLFHQALLLARRPAARDAAQSSPTAARRWLLVEVGGSFGSLLAAEIAARDESITRLDAQTLLDEPERRAEAIFSAGFDFIVFDASAAPVSSDIEAPRLDTTRLLLGLLQAVAAHGAQRGARLWVATRGARAVNASDAMPAVADAALWGLADVVELEYPQLRCSCVDLDSADAAAAAAVVEEIASADAETRLAYRKGERLVARLTRVEPRGDGHTDSAQRQQRAISLQPGRIEGLRFVDVPRGEPGYQEVEIRVRAAGLNFKDVLGALAQLDIPVAGLGHECAGEIVRAGAGVRQFSPGDAVLAFTPGSLADYVTVNAAFVALKPAAMTYEQAASLPGAFLTAHHALHELARLRRGESVLIHAASGGVGLAAVQMAQRMGATVFATAGSEAKRALLGTLGVEHVFDSRSAAFGEQVRRGTAGRGVDVVLNSLTGEVRDASMRVLASGGRFIELGRGPAQTEASVKPGQTYFNPDVAAEYAADEGRFGTVFHDLIERHARAELQLLPYRSFQRDELAAAFRLMARAGHIGKVVVQLAPEYPADQADAGVRLSSEARYLIAGGLGDLGLRVAAHLVDRGARHLALLSRREPGDTERMAIEALRSRGADVLLLQGDVAEVTDVARAMDRIRERPQPLRGVIHAAGLLDDGVLEQQNWRRFQYVLAPKVNGAWNLHRATIDTPLDFFVLFSSVASLLGSPGQGNHAAANAFMDALAWHRRARGLPALSINWGAWSGIGAAARAGISGRLALRGIGEISPAQGLAALDHLLSWEGAQIGVVPVDWGIYRQQFAAHGEPPRFAEVLAPAARSPETATATPQSEVRARLAMAAPGQHAALLADFIRDEVAKALGLESGAQIPMDRPLASLGVDSLLAVELRNSLGGALGLARRLPATLLFDYPSISALIGYLLAGPLESVTGNPAPVADSTLTGLAQDEAVIAGLSDQEAEALLIKELG